MTKIFPIRPDGATDDQLAAMMQAVGRTGDEPWVGDMGAALECCDRGWLSVAHLSDRSDDRNGVFYRSRCAAPRSCAASRAAARRLERSRPEQWLASLEWPRLGGCGRPEKA
jgi:hypothetical protein